MVLGVPWEAVSSQGTGPASFATGRGVVCGALGRARDAGSGRGAGILARLGEGVRISLLAEALTGQFPGQSPNVGKGESCSLSLGF